MTAGIKLTSKQATRIRTPFQFGCCALQKFRAVSVLSLFMPHISVLTSLLRMHPDNYRRTFLLAAFSGNSGICFPETDARDPAIGFVSRREIDNGAHAARVRLELVRLLLLAVICRPNRERVSMWNSGELIRIKGVEDQD